MSEPRAAYEPVTAGAMHLVTCDPETAAAILGATTRALATLAALAEESTRPELGWPIPMRPAVARLDEAVSLVALALRALLDEHEAEALRRLLADIC